MRAAPFSALSLGDHKSRRDRVACAAAWSHGCSATGKLSFPLSLNLMRLSQPAALSTLFSPLTAVACCAAGASLFPLGRWRSNCHPSPFEE